MPYKLNPFTNRLDFYEAGSTPVVPLPVADGGTGRTTLTDGAFLIGDGTNPVEMLGPGTNGQIPIGSTGATAVLALPTSTGGTLTITPGAGTLNFEVTNPTGFAWTTVVGTTQAMAVDNGYIANDLALVTLTLPAVAAVGDTIQVAGKGSGGWSIAQNAGQVIHLNSTDTTPGVGGSLASTNQYNAVELLCITANTDWLVLDSSGTLTVT